MSWKERIAALMAQGALVLGLKLALTAYQDPALPIHGLTQVKMLPMLLTPLPCAQVAPLTTKDPIGRTQLLTHQLLDLLEKISAVIADPNQ